MNDLVRIMIGYASLILAVDLDPRVLQRVERVGARRVHQVVTYEDERRWRFSVDRWTRFDELYAKNADVPMGRRIRDREGYLLMAGVWWWYQQTVFGVSDRELARGGIARTWHTARRKMPRAGWPLPTLDKDVAHDQAESMRVLVARYIKKVERELWPVLGMKAEKLS